MAGKYWWIKERHNPQFKKPYFVECGIITVKMAKEYEKPLYGDVIMHRFDTYDAYQARITELKSHGAKFIEY